MDDLTITKTAVLKLAEKYPEAKAALEELCPEVFEEIEVGDIVEVVGGEGRMKTVGARGIVRATTGRYHEAYGVEFFDAFVGGHELKGLCKFGYGQWMVPRCLRLVTKGKVMGRKKNRE